jgi:hypothetical protein
VSWRDDAAPETLDLLDALLDTALRAGREQLDHAGEFFPFAVTVDATGDTDVLQPALPASRDVAEVHERCWQALAERAGDLAAAAVVTNVGGGAAGEDAIAVALEDRDGVAIEVFLPYVTQRKVNGKKPAQKHRFGDLLAAEGTRRVWV